MTDRGGLGRLLDDVGDPDDVAVFVMGAPDDEPTATTRADLEHTVASLVDQLSTAGVEPGHAVCACLENGADVVAALFAVWSVGAVYAPINPRSTDSETTHVIDLVGPAAIITTPDAAPRFGDHPVITLDSGSVMPNARPGVQSASQNDERHGTKRHGTTTRWR